MPSEDALANARVRLEVKRYCRREGVSQTEVAEIIGYSRQQLSRVMNEHDRVTEDFAVAMEDSLGVNAYWLLHGDRQWPVPEHEPPGTNAGREMRLDLPSLPVEREVVYHCRHCGELVRPGTHVCGNCLWPLDWSGVESD